MRRIPWWCLPLVLAACARGVDHERMGDRRYAEQSWADALAEYRLAARQHRPTLELRAKIGAAALHAGELVGAAAAYRDLGAADASAADEAAEGLLRTARAAITGRDVAALAAALAALRVLAPSRLPELGDAVMLGLGERRPQDPALLLVASASTGGTTADSLAMLWAEANAHAGRCDRAMPAYRSLIRRGTAPTLARIVKGGLAGCEVAVGREALAEGRLVDAEAAFRAAVVLGVPDSTMRIAWVLIGDTRWADGDTALALEAYRKALVGADDDSPIAQRAREQLQRLLGNPTTP